MRPLTSRRILSKAVLQHSQYADQTSILAISGRVVGIWDNSGPARRTASFRYSGFSSTDLRCSIIPCEITAFDDWYSTRITDITDLLGKRGMLRYIARDLKLKRGACHSED